MHSARQWIVVNLILLGITLAGADIALYSGLLLEPLRDSQLFPYLVALAGLAVFCLPFLLICRLFHRRR